MTPSDYSNRLMTSTIEDLPDKVDHLRGYAWNSSTIIVHWMPVNSTNGPNFVRNILMYLLIESIVEPRSNINDIESIYTCFIRRCLF
jgi:hypothetical protein